MPVQTMTMPNNHWRLCIALSPSRRRRVVEQFNGHSFEQPFRPGSLRPRMPAPRLLGSVLFGQCKSVI
jgi:hypothetical protein